MITAKVILQISSSGCGRQRNYMDNTQLRALPVDEQLTGLTCQKLITVPNDFEPTSEEVAEEAKKIKGAAKPATKTSARTKDIEDLVSTYMAQLSHIPLFTPEEEIHCARNIETLELHTWFLLVQEPRAVHIIRGALPQDQQPLYAQATKLLTSYQRAIKRSAKGTIRPHKTRTKLQNNFSMELRRLDQDKELLDSIMMKVRKTMRQSKNSSWWPSVSRKHLTEIDRARGTALRGRNNFVRANLRLVVSVAKRFHCNNLAFIDLVQEGNVGLMKAVHRFDYQKGYRFSTYAHWWIRQSIERAIINKGSQVRLPVHIIDTRRQANKAASHLKQMLGRTPTKEEIAQKLNMTEKRLRQLLGNGKPQPISLDDNNPENGRRSFLEILRDRSRPAIDEALIRENTLNRVRDLMGLLNPMERDIIQRRFGLTGNIDETLDDIGKSYNLSRERVRQIQVQGLAKMRRMCDRRRIGYVPSA